MRHRATTSNARVRVSKDGDEAVCRHASRRRTARPSWRGRSSPIPGDLRVRRTKRASAGHDDLRWEGENQPVAVEKDACRGLPVSSLLFTGSCTTAARSSDTRLEIRADDPQGSGFASASHRTRPPLFGASKNSNLQVYKIVAVTHPLFPIVFINGKSNWSV